MKMKNTRNKKMLGLAIDPALLARLDAWRLKQDVPPSKTAVLEAAIRDFLNQRDNKANPRAKDGR